MFLLFYDYVENIVERRAPHRDAHLELAREWKAAGKFVMGGAIGDPPHGGVLVFDVHDPSVVEAFAEADPYVRNGLVSARRVEYWNVVV